MKSTCRNKVKIKIPRALFITVSFFIFCSCAKHSQERILSKDLSSFLSDSFNTTEWNFNDFECHEPEDTNSVNVPLSYLEAIASLQKHFHRIDSLSINEQTKEYAKALVVADFVYAAFSFQFLGPTLGMARDCTLTAGWDSLPLNTCYTLGNSNQTSVYCIERTSFYLRLVDTLLNIKGTSIASKVHTFPVLNLKTGRYIIDPYDPFVIADSTGIFVIDYETLLAEKINKNFRPERTKRIFGNTRELISNSFVSELKIKYNNSACLCCMLESYLEENKNYILSFLRPCFNAPAHNFLNIEIIDNKQNAYALEMTGIVDGHLDSHEDIVRYYAGVECNLKK